MAAPGLWKVHDMNIPTSLLSQNVPSLPYKRDRILSLSLQKGISSICKGPRCFFPASRLPVPWCEIEVGPPLCFDPVLDTQEAGEGATEPCS